MRHDCTFNVREHFYLFSRLCARCTFARLFYPFVHSPARNLVDVDVRLSVERPGRNPFRVDVLEWLTPFATALVVDVLDLCACRRASRCFATRINLRKSTTSVSCSVRQPLCGNRLSRDVVQSVQQKAGNRQQRDVGQCCGQMGKRVGQLIYVYNY